jgi:hypothetical protein
MAAVHRLIWAFDLDGDGGLTLLADGDLFVVSLDGCTNLMSQSLIEIKT